MRELCYIYSRKRKNTGFPCQVFQWCKGQFNRSGEKDKTRPNSEFICFSWLAHSTVVLTYPFQNEMKIKSIHGPSFFGFNGSIFILCNSVVCFHIEFRDLSEALVAGYTPYHSILPAKTVYFCPKHKYLTP